MKLTYGRRYSAVMKFYNKLEKPVNIHELYEAQKYLKIFTLAIHPDFRRKGKKKKHSLAQNEKQINFKTRI